MIEMMKTSRFLLTAFTIIVLYSLVQSEVRNYGEATEGNNITLDCYFAAKEPGVVRWRLNGTIATYSCKVLQQYSEFLAASDDCNGTDNAGVNQHYAFTLTNVSKNRDEEWACESPDGIQPLNISVRVEGGVIENTVEPVEMSDGDHLQLSVRTGCSYPPEIAEWCVKVGEVITCSSQTDWWTEVFQSEPTIQQIPVNCTSYIDPDVDRYILSIDGHIANDRGIEGQVYLEFMDEEYLENDKNGQPYFKLEISGASLVAIGYSAGEIIGILFGIAAVGLVVVGIYAYIKRR